MYIIILFISFSSTLFSQNKLLNKDSFIVDEYKFYKIDQHNYTSFLSSSSPVVFIHFSTWCSSLRHVDSSFNSLKSNCKIFMLSTDKSESPIEQVKFFKLLGIQTDILFLNFKLYKKGNWIRKLNEFVDGICANCRQEAGGHTSKHVIFFDTTRKGKLVNYKSINLNNSR